MAAQNFDEMVEQERRQLAIESPGKVAALALSGGGIRAATVARAFLRALDQANLIVGMRYISSVSGGGYAAAEFLAGEKRNTSSPRYSVFKAGVMWVAELLFRLLPLLVLATLVHQSFPSMLVAGKDKNNENILFGTILFSALVMALGIDRRGNRWRLVQLISTSVFFFLAVLWMFQLIGALVSACTTVAFFVLVSAYARSMPHRRATLDDFRHWPRWLVFCFTVSALLWLAPALLTFEHQHAEAFQICIALAIVAYIGTAWTMVSKPKGGQRKYGEPVFSYYRNVLARCFVKADQDLEQMRSLQNMPYPIFNATAYDGRSRARFEMTPHYHGSDHLNYIATEKLPTKVTLADAVAASGSAIDGAYHDWDNRALTSLFFAGTGFWMFFGSGPLTIRMIVNLLWHVIRNTPSRHFLRLSDGGFTDNLGIVALLKRRAGLIVCLDAAYDPEFSFADLRHVCEFSASEGIATIDTNGLVHFAQTHRFSGTGLRFLRMPIKYSETERGVLILVKLASIEPTESKRRFPQFPHITTSDQQLTAGELKELYAVGEALAAESEAAINSAMTALETS